MPLHHRLRGRQGALICVCLALVLPGCPQGLVRRKERGFKYNPFNMDALAPQDQSGQDTVQPARTKTQSFYFF